MLKRSYVQVETVTAGVDWISGTLGREELDNQTWMYDCLHALEKVQSYGNTYKRRALLGFDGWESGGCFVGSNETMHYAQFAGKYADDAYIFLEHPKVHISRIDLQITVKYSEELLKEGRYQYARAMHHNKTLLESRQRKIHLFAGSDGGDTVYLGAPSSEQRARIYNKHKQSGESAYERSWRYEAVYRNNYASSVYRVIVSTPDALNTVIIPTVIEFFRLRGVSILGLEHWHGRAADKPEPPTTDVQRKLLWIRNQVVPTIRKLAELGYAEELMEEIAEAIAAARNSQI
jgi:DNA relaxase NicK